MPDIANNRSLKEAMRLTKAKSDRLAWALKDHGHLLASAVGKDTSPEAREVEKLPPEQIPEYVARQILERADPTSAKTMTGWLVQQYAQGTLRLEDTGTARETLGMFEKYARKLPLGRRDLGKYVSLADVWNGVVSLAEAERDKLGGKAQKAMERDKAYAESRILRQDEDGFTIAVPLTEFAAKWLGRGTRWCTVAEKDNQFWHYHQQAPLIVMVIPELKGCEKVQLWVTKNNFQFMDAADRIVSKDLIIRNWRRFEGVIFHALQQNGMALALVPDECQTQDLCKAAIKQNPFALGKISPALLSADLCEMAVSLEPGALMYVPTSLMTKDLCERAVLRNGAALELVPLGLRDKDLCELAVGQCANAIKSVPGPLVNEELAAVAVAREDWLLGSVPERLRTRELCELALRSPRSRHILDYESPLAYVPHSLLTEEFCKIGVEKNAHTLRHVPQWLRSSEICEIAVKKDGMNLEYVPIDLRTEELYLIAVAQNGAALAHVPGRLRTEELCRIAVTRNGLALGAVPWILRTKEMCDMAVAQDGGALRCVPDALRTEALCKIAVAQKWLALLDVPYALCTEEVCRIAVAQNGNALKYVPEALRDRMGVLTPVPLPEWDLLLLDDLAVALGSPTSPDLSGPSLV
jgi:hypothetical protein